MNGPRLVVFISFLVFVSCLMRCTASDPYEDFRQCLILADNSFANDVYTPKNSSFSSILHFPINNRRFNTTNTPEPAIIVTPFQASEVQSTVTCAGKYGLHLRVRSGGHDYEGLSYTTRFGGPFVVVDLSGMRRISVDVREKTAWVESGATLGELYYEVANKSRNLGFPGGVCSTVGVGGYISGGGYGAMLRKYGLAADNVVDALLVDAKGRIVDRKSMGEDNFWAIRGGGGNTFGIVLSWKLQLVYVPDTVMVFTVNKDLEQNAAKLVHKWQFVAPKMPPELFLRINLWQANPTQKNGNNRTVVANFVSTFLGSVETLISIMQEKFPELGLRKEDCIEMSWVESTLYFYGLPTDSPVALLSRVQIRRSFFKAKSDYVQEPIPEEGLEGLWKLLMEDKGKNAMMVWNPYGGRMDEISESAIPFPHRSGNLYKIQHLVYWGKEDERNTDWLDKLYDYLTPFVSSSPRASYINYRDIDLGLNSNGNTSYAQAKVWGYRYFKNNFDRLVKVKTKVDPSNFFRNEQSIPPITR